MTWYPQDFTKVPMTDMRMRPQLSSGYPGRTYRFYNGKKVFEFGYGLSYSNYSYELASDAQNKLYLRASSNQITKNSNTIRHKLISNIGKELCEKTKFTVTVRVKNHGEMAGKHPVLLFVRQANPGNERPIKKLVGFQTVKLGAGEKTEIEYELSPCEHLSSANEDGVMVMEEGSQILLVGDKEHPVTIIV